MKHIRAGETVSYGARFTAERPTRIAVIPAGYADGIDLRMAGRGFVLVRGRRAPIVGAVCMDMLMVDVTDIPGAALGDVVTLIGRDAEDSITVDGVLTQYPIPTSGMTISTGIGRSSSTPAPMPARSAAIVATLPTSRSTIDASSSGRP